MRNEDRKRSPWQERSRRRNRSDEAEAVAPEVQSKVAGSAAAKRAQLLADAQTALAETNTALKALDDGKTDEALAALEKVTGKLDLMR